MVVTTEGNISTLRFLRGPALHANVALLLQVCYLQSYAREHVHLRLCPLAEIRTSVSPDRILRRRRTLHRLGPRPDPPDIIDVCSDSEELSSAEEPMDVHPSHTPSSSMSSQPSTQSSSATLVTRSVVFIDLTRIPSTSPRRRASATTSSQAPIPRSQSAETSSSARSTVVRSAVLLTSAYLLMSLQRPQWLEDAIRAIEDEFPRARFVVSAQGMLLTGRPENWELMCNECDEYVVSPTTCKPSRLL